MVPTLHCKTLGFHWFSYSLLYTPITPIRHKEKGTKLI